MSMHFLIFHIFALYIVFHPCNLVEFFFFCNAFDLAVDKMEESIQPSMDSILSTHSSGTPGLVMNTSKKYPSCQPCDKS